MVRCSRPDARMAPSTVPTTAQQTPTKAIRTINHLIDAACVRASPQQDFGSSERCDARPEPPRHLQHKHNAH